jgi:hypothetical protein
VCCGICNAMCYLGVDANFCERNPLRCYARDPFCGLACACKAEMRNGLWD